MPTSRPSSSGGRRPPNATLSTNDTAGAAAKRSNSAINLNNDHHSGSNGALAASTSSAGARRQSDHSDGTTNDEARRLGAAGHHRVGPKRKSKVGISGLADQTHHFGHAHARKKNASSSALSRRDKSRSHLALTHVASELAGLAQVSDTATAGEYLPAARTSKSRERKAKAQSQLRADEGEDNEGDQPAAPVVAGTEDDENEAGWISATSSAAATPQAGTSPVSPESYKALEFGKKSRRKKAPPAEHVQPLDFPKYEPRQSLQRTATEEEELLGSTPRQRESALSLAAPKSVMSPSPLSKSDYISSDHDTLPPQASGTSNLQSDEPPPINDPEEADRKVVDSGFTADEHPSDLPQPTGQNQRPSTMRKSSTSTIRSLASVGGTRPLSSSIRRQTLAPLQPRLDTSVEGFGQLKHVGLTPKENDTAFPAAEASNPRAHRRQHSGASLGTGMSKAGTLSPQEADELAKRLRTVSGSDIPANNEPDFGQYPVRGTLRRSASTAQGATLASLQKYGIASPKGEQPPSSVAGGGAFGTLKRASGYFGSMTRLTSLGSTLGLTSLDKGSQVPSPTSPANRRTPSSAGSRSAAQSSTSPMQRLQGAYGLRGARSSTVQVRQPLISKFIDPSESYQPFPKASASPTTSQSRPPGLTRGGTSRARQKLLTQRDYPDEYSMPQEGSSSVISDEDPMASQVNLRKNLSSKNLSGTATPLQPGVQRWLVALSKEAERIDRDHETFARFHDTMQASFARILERRAVEEQEELKAWNQKLQNDKGQKVA